MKKCKNCQAEIEKSAKVCPKCGAKQGMPTWAKVLIIVGVVLLLLGGCVVGCVGLVGVSIYRPLKQTEALIDEKTDIIEDIKSGNTDAFELIEHHISDESTGTTTYIEGKIQNVSEKDFKAVYVSFYAYDAEGNNIGECTDFNSGLGPNDTWKFKAHCSVTEKVDHYKLSDIHGM